MGLFKYFSQGLYSMEKLGIILMLLLSDFLYQLPFSTGRKLMTSKSILQFASSRIFSDQRKINIGLCTEYISDTQKKIQAFDPGYQNLGQQM